jgi:hypothetical protein
MTFLYSIHRAEKQRATLAMYGVRRMDSETWFNNTRLITRALEVDPQRDGKIPHIPNSITNSIWHSALSSLQTRYLTCGCFGLQEQVVSNVARFTAVAILFLPGGEGGIYDITVPLYFTYEYSDKEWCKTDVAEKT